MNSTITFNLGARVCELFNLFIKLQSLSFQPILESITIYSLPNVQYILFKAICKITDDRICTIAFKTLNNLDYDRHQTSIGNLKQGLDKNFTFFTSHTLP